MGFKLEMFYTGIYGKIVLYSFKCLEQCINVTYYGSLLGSNINTQIGVDDL